MRLRSLMCSVAIAVSGCAAEPPDEIESADNGEGQAPSLADTKASSSVDDVASSADDGQGPPSLKESALCFNRSDFRATALVSSGHYGSWASCVDFCPDNSWVWSINTLFDCQGGGSDCSGINTITLGCHDRNGNWVGTNVSSSAGWWGGWLGWATSANGNPAKGMSTFTMPKKGGGDDQSMTVAQLIDGSGNTFGSSFGFNSGDVFGSASCPAGTRICGLQTRLEAKQGTSNDDTALNGVNLACCIF
jgi:Vitelline membrane outer layer protein I (VOMI)